MDEGPASPTPYDPNKGGMYAYWANMVKGKQGAQGGPQPAPMGERGGRGGPPMPPP